MSRSRDHRYYDDSDDMVERIRRVREAFEKKTRAFQGPDWPYYEKRVIVGRKKKEDMEIDIAENSAVAAVGTQAAASSPSPQSAGGSESDDTATAEQTSAWWAAHRHAQKKSAAAATSDKSPKVNTQASDKADA